MDFSFFLHKFLNDLQSRKRINFIYQYLSYENIFFFSEKIMFFIVMDGSCHERQLSWKAVVNEESLITPLYHRIRTLGVVANPQDSPSGRISYCSAQTKSSMLLESHGLNWNVISTTLKHNRETTDLLSRLAHAPPGSSIHQS